MTVTPMTREEIIRDYRQAANKQHQIGVLADLNLCTKAENVALLRDAGERVSGNYNSVPTPQTAPAPRPAEAEEPPADPASAEESAEPDRDVIRVIDALPVMIRSAAVQVIAQLIKKADAAAACAVQDDRWWIETNFREQCRGVLALVDEVEKRCMSVEEEAAE